MNVKKRRVLAEVREKETTLPEKKIDITDLMDQIMTEIEAFFNLDENKLMTFYDICPEDAGKHDKVLTLIPLLHLSSSRRIDLEQKTHFGDIYISPAEKSKTIIDKMEKADEILNAGEIKNEA